MLHWSVDIFDRLSAMLLSCKLLKWREIQPYLCRLLKVRLYCNRPHSGDTGCAILRL